jgi:hypothetical protein
MLTFLTLVATVFYYDDDLELGCFFFGSQRKTKLQPACGGQIGGDRRHTPTYLPTYLPMW